MLPSHSVECDGLNENFQLTEIWFSGCKREQIMILNLHTDLNQVEKNKNEL